MKIVFLDMSPIDYVVETPYEKPLGGSQSALCYLAEALVQRGHAVVTLTLTTQPGRYRGVTCLPAKNTPADVLRGFAPDVLIALNGVVSPRDLRVYIGPDPLLTLWIQHAAVEETVRCLSEPDYYQGYDAIAFVSQWQRSMYLEHYPIAEAATGVCGNAIAPALAGMFSPGTSISAAKSSPPVLAYTSTPFRGLKMLVELFPAIRREVPGTRLRVFSSLQVYHLSKQRDEQLFGPLYQACRETEGVELVGAIPQHQLAEELRTATALAYPNTFAETSCIAVMEAMAAGCGIISSRFGALPETTAGFADLIPLGEGMPAYQARFVQSVVGFLRGGARWEDHLRRQVDFVNAEYTWARRAAQWEAWLTERIERRRSGR